MRTSTASSFPLIHESQLVSVSAPALARPPARYVVRAGHSDPAPHSHLMTTRRTSSAPVKTVSAVAVWLPRRPRPQPGPPRPQPRPLATYARPSAPAHRSLDLSRVVLPIHAEAQCFSSRGPSHPQGMLEGTGGVT